MDKTEIEKLHNSLLTFWNSMDAQGMASLFAEDGNVIGFDGSQMNGKVEIARELETVFQSHKTARYVWKTKEVKFLQEGTAVLRAIVGMVPPGKKDLKPEVNAIQSLVAILRPEGWRISLFQNTPARFDGRPELVEALTNELRQLL